MHNPEALQQLVWTEQAYKFLENIRGSPAYWQSELYDVLAMFCKLGIPTWFLTLLAADLHWSQMIQAVAYQFGRKLSQEDVLRMSMAERSKYLHQNPVTGVRMFQHRVQSFFAQYLLSDAHPLGEITDYVIKIEFQIRGSPHAHCLLWVKDAPKIDQNPDEFVIDFIDKYITATLPNHDHAYEKELSQQTYNTTLQTSHRGPNVILKQNQQDVFLNACNQGILYLLGGNIDLQLVINEIQL